MKNILARLRVWIDEFTRAYRPGRRVRFDLARAAFERFAAGRQIAVMDAGCSEGLFAEVLARRHRQWAIDAVDIDPEAVELAADAFRRRGLENASASVGDLTAALPEDRYDAIAALECLALVESDAEAMASIARALKPGGVFVAHVAYKDWRPILSSRDYWPGERKHGYTVDEIEGLVRAAGLELTSITPTARSVGRMGTEIAGRIERSGLAARAVWFPFAVLMGAADRRGITWGAHTGYFIEARAPAAEAAVPAVPRESDRRAQKQRARQERRKCEAGLPAAARRRRARTRATGAISVVAVPVALAFAIAGGSGGGPGASQGLGSTPELKLSSLPPLGALRSPGSLGSVGPEGVPVPTAPELASTSSMASGDSVDGIRCLRTQQTQFHIHVHLAVFVDGAPRQIPYGIGITRSQIRSTAKGPYVGTGSCFYWLHTHAADGIIHIESPVHRTYTLGDFFDVWGEPLGPRQAGPAVGPVTAIYNGKRYDGNPRDIPLTTHAKIQLDVGSPLVAPVAVTFTDSI